ncbi:hypothetical protein [Nesterenkonia suensis]
MSEHTPSEKDVRSYYVGQRFQNATYAGKRSPSIVERYAEFDRWLAAVVRDAKVAALREAAEGINGEARLLQCPRPETRAQSWLLDRADQIETERNKNA